MSLFFWSTEFFHFFSLLCWPLADGCRWKAPMMCFMNAHNEITSVCFEFGNLISYACMNASICVIVSRLCGSKTECLTYASALRQITRTTTHNATPTFHCIQHVKVVIESIRNGYDFDKFKRALHLVQLYSKWRADNNYSSLYHPLWNKFFFQRNKKSLCFHCVWFEIIIKLETNYSLFSHSIQAMKNFGSYLAMTGFERPLNPSKNWICHIKRIDLLANNYI